MSATDALTITSALDALTRYYDAKEREESAVLYINDAYLEALNSLEKLEAENAKLRELVRELWAQAEQNLVCDENCPYGATCNWMDSDVVCVFKRHMRELGVEVD